MRVTMMQPFWMVITQEGTLIGPFTESDANSTACSIGIIWTVRPIPKHLDWSELK